jgi:mannose-6-phosphate isomerase-like protein (cupin superfamily)
MTTDAPQVFKYEKPALDKPKAVVLLSRTDISLSTVQIVREGGENNLHSHRYLDGFWFVLSGRARFYTDGDAVIAELGPHEGVLIPRGYRYWFEAVTGEDLEILQVESSSKRMESLEEIAADREDVETERPKWMSGVATDLHDGDVA